jgi:hypothetical protein
MGKKGTPAFSGLTRIIYFQRVVRLVDIKERKEHHVRSMAYKERGQVKRSENCPSDHLLEYHETWHESVYY